MNRVVRLVGSLHQEVTLVGGILGLKSDVDLVDAEFQRPVASLLLGIPFEDLDSIHATAGQETTAEFEASTLDEVYLKSLAKHGAVQTPPPDLYAAVRHAKELGLAVEAIDLGDEAHTESYTKHVGMFEVLRNNRIQRRLIERPPEAKDGAAFALAWDAALHDTRGLRRLQEQREEWMASRIRQRPSGTGPHLVLLPLPRMAGVERRLREAGYRDAPAASRPAALHERVAGSP